eukprot:m.471127 g.471127  ORF g.471127 m.471127 type:complete len:356 (-) comp30673_c0_seq1:295-1362(-)
MFAPKRCFGHPRVHCCDCWSLVRVPDRALRRHTSRPLNSEVWGRNPTHGVHTRTLAGQSRPPPSTLRDGAMAASIGVAAGGFGSLVGMGGGFVSIPLLTTRLLRSPLPQHRAHAVSLVAVMACGASGAATFFHAGEVDVPAAVAIGAGGLATAFLGARAASAVSPKALLLGLGLFQLAVAPVVYCGSRLKGASNDSGVAGSTGSHSGERGSSNLDGPKIAKLVAVGCGVGIAVGLLGVGGGAISVPAITVFLPDLSHHQAVGTSLAAMIPPTIGGLLQHSRSGVLTRSVALGIGAPLALGTAVGAALSAEYVALRLDEQTLRAVFAVVMIVLGGRSIVASRALRGALALTARKSG